MEESMITEVINTIRNLEKKGYELTDFEQVKQKYYDGSCTTDAAVDLRIGFKKPK